MKRISVIWAYLKNTRLKQYRTVLEMAKEKNYTLCSVEESLNHIHNGVEKIIVLRHDVDIVSPGTKAMFEMEKALGVSSVYYFRKTTIDLPLIKEMLLAGFEVSFHYESLAEVGKSKGVDESDSVDESLMDAGKELLKIDLFNFRKKTSASCKTLASHGNLWNRRVGIANTVLLKDEDLRAALGIEIETYDQKYLACFDQYVMDQCIGINGGFAYGTRIEDIIAAEIPRIVFLAHPNHWKYTLYGKLRISVRTLITGVKENKRNFAFESFLRHGRQSM